VLDSFFFFFFFFLPTLVEEVFVLRGGGGLSLSHFFYFFFSPFLQVTREVKLEGQVRSKDFSLVVLARRPEYSGWDA